MCMPHTADRRDRADRSIDGEAWMKLLRVFCIDCLPIRSLARHTHTHRMLAQILHRIETSSRPSAKRVAERESNAHATAPVCSSCSTLATLAAAACAWRSSRGYACAARAVLNSLTPRRRSSRRCKSCTGSRPRRGGVVHLLHRLDGRRQRAGGDEEENRLLRSKLDALANDVHELADCEVRRPRGISFCRCRAGRCRRCACRR